jgi:molecular chaperone GrpE
MSGEPSQDELEPADAAGQATGGGDGGVIPVEVEQPDPAGATADAAATDASAEAPPPPPTPADPVVELTAKLAAAEKEKKDNWDRYLRAAADIENLRKRQKRELEDAKFDTKNKVLKEMLPVVDNLERAIEHAAGAGEKNPIVEGVQLVLRQFTTAFERLEVTSIDAQGQPFDPNLHEAISQQESELAPGTVVQVLQRGYKVGDRLLRPSLVVVAKAKAGEG